MAASSTGFSAVSDAAMTTMPSTCLSIMSLIWAICFSTFASALATTRLAISGSWAAAFSMLEKHWLFHEFPVKKPGKSDHETFLGAGCGALLELPAPNASVPAQSAISAQTRIFFIQTPPRTCFVTAMNSVPRMLCDSPNQPPQAAFDIILWRIYWPEDFHFCTIATQTCSRGRAGGGEPKASGCLSTRLCTFVASCRCAF